MAFYIRTDDGVPDGGGDYYVAHGLAGNNKILSSILGRKPTSYLDFAKAALK